MYEQIRGNLVRQTKGLEVLALLLEEEFAHLRGRDPDAVSAVEFSIHELMRQLACERVDLKAVMQRTRLSEYADMLPEEQGVEVRAIIARIDVQEQHCARQASLNADLALALLDQSQELLDFLHRRLVPPKQETYGRKGGMTTTRAEAALIRGRL